MNRPAAPGSASVLPILLIALGLAAVLGTVQTVASWQRLAAALGDTDDALRLSIVRDLLAGKAWFDVNIARLQPPAGLDSHWSRLIDGGIAGLILLFRTVLSTADAELAARIVWPVLWIVPTAAAALLIARRLGGRGAVFAGVIVLAITLPAYVQFRPGRVDHHNVQIACLMLALAGTVLLDERRWAGALAGAATGLLLAIGLEALLPAAALGAIIALRFGLRPALAPAARRYGLWLAGTVLALHLAQSGPRAALAACDTLGANLVAGLIVAGLGLALATALAGPGRRAGLRWSLLAATGAAAGLVYIGLDPACLAGPFGGIDPRIVPIWLDQVKEMQPLWDVWSSDPRLAVLITVPPLLALGMLAVLLRGAGRAHDPAWLSGAALVCLTAFAMVVLGAPRGCSYAIWTAMPVIAAGIAALTARLRVSGMLARAALTCFSSPLMLTFLLFPLMPGDQAAKAQRQAAVQGCFDTASYATLAAQPPGLVLADVDLGPFILANTPHAAVSAPYHRMAAGLLAGYEAMAAPPAEAAAKIRALGAGYVVTCSAIPRDQPWPEGSLRDALAAGAVPEWLQPVGPAGPLQIYRVIS